MEDTSLRFASKEQLLAFLAHTGNTCCTIDLRNFILSSNFSEEELHIAEKQFRARVITDSLIY